MSPKKEEDPRVVFPCDLGKKLLRAAHTRGHPDSQLSPLLRALASEWIEKGSFRRREEELREITDRLAAVEDQLHALTEALIDVPSPGAIEQTTKVSSSRIDNLTLRVLEHLKEITDESGVTMRVTAQQIAAAVARKEDKPSGKKITERVKKLIAKGLLSIEEDSGGRGGRRYRVESNSKLEP